MMINIKKLLFLVYNQHYGKIYHVLNNTNTAIYTGIWLLLRKLFNICLYKREYDKQWSNENGSEKFESGFNVGKNCRRKAKENNVYLHLFIVNDKEPEDFPFWNIFVSSVKNYKIIHRMKCRGSNSMIKNDKY